MALRQRVEALKAPEPDGQAAVCKTAEAGSTPAGASQRLPRRSPLVVHPHGPYRDVAVGVGRRELLAPIRRLIKPCPMRVGPTHRRVPQPGRARNRQGASQAGSCQTANDGSDKSGMGVPRSKRGTRPMPAWLFGGTRQRRIQFCASGWEETKEGAAVWWRSPDDRTWL